MSYFQDQRSKRHNNLTVHSAHLRLICPGNMKQLLCVVSEYWPKQNCDRQVDGNNGTDGHDGRGNNHPLLANIWLKGTKYIT